MGRFFLDTEFWERATPTGGSIDLISIGIVSEDNRELYLECSDFDWGEEKLDPWLLENVKPYLSKKGVPMKTIAKAIISFIGDDLKPEIWAYYAAYDWVAFCWIFGRMIDLPSPFPRFIRDFRQKMDFLEIKRSDLPPKPPNSHHALADAKWLKEAFEATLSY